MYTDIPFLAKLDFDSLRLELLEVQSSYDAITSRHFVPYNSKDTMTLSSFYSSFLADPSSISTTQAISLLWPALQSLANTEAMQSLERRLLQKAIMISNYYAWYWLEVTCNGIISSVLRDVPVPQTWIAQLTRQIKTLVMSGIDERELRPADFSQLLPGQPYIYKRGRSKFFTSNNLPLDHMAHIVIDIIQTWLGFPTHNMGRSQAWFVSILISEIGGDTLLLDATWRTYRFLRSMIFGSSSVPPLTSITIFDPLRAALKEHPLSSESSEERLLVTKLADLLNRIQKSKDHHHRDPTENYTTEHLDIILQFIRSLIPLVSSSSLSIQTKFQAYVQRSPDKFLPFRERAPCRVRFAGPDSPFSPNNVKTREGLFSALIMRGITYATAFSMEQKMMFLDLNDWNSTITSIQQNNPRPASYFCNPGAYGSLNPKRTVTLAQSYWDAVGIAEWETLLESSGKVSFMDIYKFFLKGSPKVFQQIGDLAGYLLSADYVYAGVVEIPTIEEMGTIIRKINRGAVAGLEILGLISPRGRTTRGTYQKADEKECISGFRKLYEYLDGVLSPEEKDIVGFDTIMVEHTLCKLSRAVNYAIFVVN